jgi:hypothetical protein
MRVLTNPMFLADNEEHNSFSACFVNRAYAIITAGAILDLSSDPISFFHRQLIDSIIPNVHAAIRFPSSKEKVQAAAIKD